MSQVVEHAICLNFSCREYYTYLEEILWRGKTPKDKLKMPNVINTLNCTK